MASETVESVSSQQAQGQKQGDQARGKLVQRLMASGANMPAFMNDLLSTQAMVVAGTEAVAFIIERVEASFKMQPIIHMRPDQATEETRAAAINAFMQIIRPCVEQNREGAFEVGAADDTGELQYCLATPLRTDGNAVAITAVVTRCRNLDRAKQRLASMELVAGYFELFALKKAADQSKQIAVSHQGVLQLLGAVSTVDGFEAAARNMANELATRTGATRVVIGWLKGANIHVKAMSHTEKFDKKQELIRQTRMVMEECVDQDQIVHFDPAGGGTETVKREAEAYSRANGGCVVLTAPLRKGYDLVGAITLEFPSDKKPDENTAQMLAIASDVLTPQLFDRYENDHYIWVKVGHTIRKLAKDCVGEKYTTGKLIAAGVILSLILMFAVHRTYCVSSPFQFVAEERYALVAPAEGFIGKLGEVNGEMVRPGMRVKKYEVLFSLDTTELQLKRSDAQTRANSLQYEADQKANEGKQAEAVIALSKRDAALAEVKLFTYQIERAVVKSPIDGEILQGDLRERRGSPVKEGDMLMEVASTDKLEVEVTASERDIQQVQVGQKGELATTGQPNKTYRFEVARIVPLGEPKEGANVFKIYGKLDESVAVPPQWKPGVAGESRIEVDRRSIAWIWTHRLTDYIRLQLWKLPWN